MNSCFSCRYYHRHRESESWELDHIFWYVHVCNMRPRIENLKQFPFKNTNCNKWEKYRKEAVHA